MNINAQDKTIQDIKAEVRLAREIFPSNKHKLAALLEEVGELSHALLEHDFVERQSPNQMQALAELIYREAIQVACMAIRVAEEGDASFRYTGVKGAWKKT